MSRRQDLEKDRYSQRTIREAARSLVSSREFCQLRKLDACQFYWRRERSQQARLSRRAPKPGGASRPASFALVSAEPGATDAGIELVLGGGRRLRINRGVDEATLLAVLAAVERPGC